jgi:hypothetical protein
MRERATCSVKINRHGYAYLPQHLGSVRAGWVRRGERVVVTLRPRSWGKAGATHYILPLSLMKRILCSRPWGFARVVFRKDKEDGSWIARFRISRGCLDGKA